MPPVANTVTLELDSVLLAPFPLIVTILPFLLALAEFALNATQTINAEVTVTVTPFAVLESVPTATTTPSTAELKFATLQMVFALNVPPTLIVPTKMPVVLIVSFPQLVVPMELEFAWNATHQQ